jgi:tetratricopeptide (TPR) repeat protein
VTNRASVFISADDGNEHARALHDALERAGIDAHLDEVDLGHGDRLSDERLFALLTASVLVAFVDAARATRRHRQEELSTALVACQALRRSGASQTELEESLLPIVVALSTDGELPAELRDAEWPLMGAPGATEALAALVQRRLAAVSDTFAIRLDRLGELTRVRDRLQESLTIPPVRSLSGIPFYHETGLPDSIGDAFVGRADALWDLHTTLASRQSQAASTAAFLEGGGGFGKTRLALEYLHRYGAEAYPGGVFWIDADVPADRLGSQQHGILQRLRPEIPELAAFLQQGRDLMAELGQALRERAASSGRVLYVVDGVPEPEAGKPPEDLSRYWPAQAQVSLLVTSRTRQAALTRSRRLPVAELEEEAARRLLTWEVGGQEAMTPEVWREIGDWAGRMPLALELLNAMLRTGAMSPSELLKVRREGGGPTREVDHSMDTLRGAVPEGSLRGVTEVLETSYRLLSAEARHALRILAWLAPDPIPVVLLADATVFSEAVRTMLWQRSFVSPVRAFGVEMYGRIHSVVSDFVRGRAGDSDGEVVAASTALAQVMTLEALRDRARWPVMRACSPHAEAVVDHGLRRPKFQPPWLGALPLGAVLVAYLLASYRLDAAVAWGRRYVEAVRDAFGEGSPMTLLPEQMVAQALLAQGDLKRARGSLERLVEGMRGSLGDDNDSTLGAQLHLATAMLIQGELAPARELLEELLPAFEALGDAGRPQVAITMMQLGMALNSQGDMTRGRELLERAIELSRSVPDGEELLLPIVVQLGMTLLRQGERARARELLQWGLEGCRRVLGDDSPATITMRASLSLVMFEQDELEGARTLMEETMASGVIADDHPGSIAMRAHLANVLHMQSGPWSRLVLGSDAGSEAGDERLKRAEEIRRQVLDATRRTFGAAHSRTLVATSNLAHSLRQRGDLAGARELVEPAARTAREVLGEEQPETLTILTNLAGVLQDLGEPARAVEIMEHVVEVRARVLGPRHPDTLSATESLAIAYESAGDGERAYALAEEGLEAYRSVFGDRDANTIGIAVGVALMAQQRGNHARAVELYREVLDVARSVHGEDDSFTLMVRMSLGKALELKGEPDEAAALAAQVADAAASAGSAASPEVALMRAALNAENTSPEEVRAALESSRRANGEDDLNTLGLTVTLGMLLVNAGDLSGAIETLAPAVPRLRRIAGVDSEMTLAATFALGSAQMLRGELGPGLRLVEEAHELCLRARGEGHWLTLMMVTILSPVLAGQGQVARAVDMVERALPVSRRTLGADHQITIAVMLNLAVVLRYQGQIERAAEQARETLETARRALGENHKFTLQVRQTAGMLGLLS